MSLFTPSLRTVSGTVAEIADTVGASGDPDFTTRAGRSLNAALKYFGGKVRWDWLQTEASPIQVYAPFSVTGATASSGQTSAQLVAGHGIKVDDWIQGAGFVLGTRVSATAAGSMGFTFPISASIGTGNQVVNVTANRDFYDLPSDWKEAYSVRLLATNRVLRLATRRYYDRTVTNEFTASQSLGYDTFAIGSKGKIRLLPSPDAADVLQLRYLRRITTYSSTATAATLDVPDDYDDYVVAWAKWHFLSDKDQGRQGQAETWLSLSQEGLKLMLKEQNDRPDRDLMFVPGSMTTWPSVNSPTFTNDPW